MPRYVRWIGSWGYPGPGVAADRRSAGFLRGRFFGEAEDVRLSEAACTPTEPQGGVAAHAGRFTRRPAFESGDLAVSSP